MPKDYLVTPQYTLGGDSFRIRAANVTEAETRALAKIKKEDWHNPDGWQVYELVSLLYDDGTVP